MWGEIRYLRKALRTNGPKKSSTTNRFCHKQASIDLESPLLLRSGRAVTGAVRGHARPCVSGYSRLDLFTMSVVYLFPSISIAFSAICFLLLVVRALCACLKARLARQLGGRISVGPRARALGSLHPLPARARCAPTAPTAFLHIFSRLCICSQPVSLMFCCSFLRPRAHTWQSPSLQPQSQPPPRRRRRRRRRRAPASAAACRHVADLGRGPQDPGRAPSRRRCVIYPPESPV